jgi:glycosyltransferase involved in cell wall biosynthesis
LIAASYDEGFGLPLIEAAHYGLPILARDIPVFREVAGNHATYFVNGSATDLAAGINQWLAAFAAGKAIPSTGMPYLSWAESAHRLSAAILSQN